MRIKCQLLVNLRLVFNTNQKSSFLVIFFFTITKVNFFWRFFMKFTVLCLPFLCIFSAKSETRGFWSNAKDKITSVIGLSTLLNKPGQQSLPKPEVTITTPKPNEKDPCNVVICGNLVVTGTIVGHQPPLAISGCEKLKIVHGTFTTPDKDQPPVIITCSGDCKRCNWSVARTGGPSSTSQFTVTFNPAFETLPTVIAVSGKDGGGGQVTVDTVTVSTAVFDTNSSPHVVHFIAIACCG